MPFRQQHYTEHTLTVNAPARSLYGLVADVTRWPAVFGPSVHVDLLEHDEYGERFEIWAVVNGEVGSWVSRRTFDADALRITFQQERSRAPIASMGGEWLFRELDGGRTEIVLRHDFTAVGDDPETVRWINEALDRNSPDELAALGRIAESGHPVDDLVFSFTDTAELPGSAADAYDFVHHAEHWAERLPHVSRVRLSEPSPGVQDLEMDTVTSDGSAHTTRSIRVCRGQEWIAYKQRVAPRLLLGHSGRWNFAEGREGSLVTATHTVAINPTAITEVLGEGSTLADARAYLRDALGRNSLATLTHAGEYAAARLTVGVD
ncbi:aromatase/cyclase [Streptomyces sp. NPDC003758]|uniref:Aromatase/cyclase n=1 Tax=Streptomyces cynarae TaxID=2981134 RepID=A0ABY6DZ95_9ACTN|nr:aromatase/cyclase [Streptomyces cynarae]UXY19488.1 aromatase/cyclase [Streptomyces cynarae]